MAEMRIMQNQEFDAQITNVQDAQGRETTFDGAPTWESSDPSIAGVEPSEDGMSAVIFSNDVDGSAVITMTADARMGNDVVPVMSTVAVTVAPGDATFFEMTVGEARDRS